MVPRWRGRRRGPVSGNGNRLGRLAQDGAGEGARCMEWDGMVQSPSGGCAGMVEGANARFDSSRQSSMSEQTPTISI